MGWESRTGGVGQFILPALDLVLQTLSFAPSRSDLGLHLFACHFGCHNAGPLGVEIGKEGREQCPRDEGDMEEGRRGRAESGSKADGMRP
jgi:hypothetical protein